jgi:hypothetical protein
VTGELASIGVIVDPQAAAELVVRAGRDRSIATVATSSERLELRVQSFLMDATLWAPATVLREGGVYRTRAALSSAADTLVVGETASSWLPFDELVPKVIGGLTTHVDPMSNDLRRESRAREHLLALLPALDARRADFLRSVEQTGDGRVGSLAGIRAVRAEPYDADPIWASQNAPDVGAAWSAGVATLGLIKAPSLVPIAPIHWFNTHSEPLVEVGGDPNNRVRLDVRMDHAALLEEHCFIDHPGGLLKTACYAGSARGFKLQLESEANMSGVEQVVEALFASLRSRSAPR